MSDLSLDVLFLSVGKLTDARRCFSFRCFPFPHYEARRGGRTCLGCPYGVAKDVIKFGILYRQHNIGGDSSFAPPCLLSLPLANTAPQRRPGSVWLPFTRSNWLLDERLAPACVFLCGYGRHGPEAYYQCVLGLLLLCGWTSSCYASRIYGAHAKAPLALFVFFGGGLRLIMDVPFSECTLPVCPVFC